MCVVWTASHGHSEKDGRVSGGHVCVRSYRMTPLNRFDADAAATAVRVDCKLCRFF